mgnify:FL=1
MLIDNESQFYSTQFDSKSSNVILALIEKMAPTDVQYHDFEQKIVYCICIKRSSSMLIHHVDEGDTNGCQNYINNCLKLCSNKIERQIFTSDAYAIKLHHGYVKKMLMNMFAIISNQKISTLIDH